MDARNLLDSLSCPVIPVIVINQLDDAVPLAERYCVVGSRLWS